LECDSERFPGLNCTVEKIQKSVCKFNNPSTCPSYQLVCLSEPVCSFFNCLSACLWVCSFVCLFVRLTVACLYVYPSDCLSACLFVLLPIYPPVRLSFCLSVCPFAHMPVSLLFSCRTVCPSVLLSIGMRICLCYGPSIFPSIRSSVCLSVYQSVYLIFICLSYLSIGLSVSVYWSVYISYPSFCVTVYVYMSICLSVYMSVCLYDILCICLSVYMIFVCMSIVCLQVSYKFRSEILKLKLNGIEDNEVKEIYEEILKFWIFFFNKLSSCARCQNFNKKILEMSLNHLFPGKIAQLVCLKVQKKLYEIKRSSFLEVSDLI